MAIVNQPVLNQELELFLQDKVTRFILNIHNDSAGTPVNQEPDLEKGESNIRKRKRRLIMSFGINDNYSCFCLHREASMIKTCVLQAGGRRGRVRMRWFTLHMQMSLWNKFEVQFIRLSVVATL